MSGLIGVARASVPLIYIRKNLGGESLYKDQLVRPYMAPTCRPYSALPLYHGVSFGNTADTNFTFPDLAIQFLS